MKFSLEQLLEINQGINQCAQLTRLIVAESTAGSSMQSHGGVHRFQYSNVEQDQQYRQR